MIQLLFLCDGSKLRAHRLLKVIVRANEDRIGGLVLGRRTEMKRVNEEVPPTEQSGADQDQVPGLQQ